MTAALYRTYLRAVRRLPHLYLRQFFAVRARTDLDALRSAPDPVRRARKHADVARRVLRLQRATAGNVKDFARVLALAYGRTGKLRWELLFPILSDPAAQPAPIIPRVPRSAPKPYSPELRRLLLSPTHRTKSVTPAELAAPRTLPARADAASPDAALFGPFSKRREANIRRRAHATFLKRVLPPLELAVRTPAGASVPDAQAVSALRPEGTAYPRPLAMQGLSLVREIEDLVGGTIHPTPPPTRRARRASQTPDQISPEPAQAASPARHPQRWVRRRYRLLLASIPQLAYDAAKGQYDVDISPLALATAHRVSHYNPPIDPVSLAWIQAGGDADAGPAKGGKQRGAAQDK